MKGTTTGEKELNKYNEKHRVLDLDARDARRREKSGARSAIKAADAVFALHEVR